MAKKSTRKRPARKKTIRKKPVRKRTPRKDSPQKLSVAEERRRLGGRPSLFTPRCRAKIIRSLRQGSYYTTAAKMAGIHPETLRRWMRRGEDAGPESTIGEDRVFFGFYGACQKAMALDERDRLKNIKNAGREGDWHADAWHLERRHRDNYSRQVMMTGRDGGPIEVSQGAITDNDRQARIQRVVTLAADVPRGKRRIVTTQQKA